MKRFVVLILIIFSSYYLNAQNFGLGASIMYNFQTESFGVGARANFFPNSTISFVPQFTYYPGWGEIKEYMIGMAIEYKIKRGNRFNYYLLAHGGYNSWLNYDASALKDAQPTNWNLEGGVGITTNTCLRPFLEYRYNIKFMETHLRLGFLYIFGCKTNSGGGHGICPAYQ